MKLELASSSDLPLDDFPAAHSMDSGWFAVDENGAVAHFDTGEGGALPNDATYLTGEAGVGSEEQVGELWFQHLLPWTARNLDTSELPKHTTVYALFDTASNAERALERDDTQPVSQNELLVELVLDPEREDEYCAGVDELEGFVGFAPTRDDVFWESEVQRFVPLAFYSHGDWDIPGHYVRESSPPAGFELDPAVRGKLTKMGVSFADADELQLADFYDHEQCTSWSEADLRTGQMPEQPRPRGFFAWLTDLFK